MARIEAIEINEVAERERERDRCQKPQMLNVVEQFLFFAGKLILNCAVKKT